MAVAFDAVGPGATGSETLAGTSASWSHTCTGSNRYLTVAVAISAASDTMTTSVTYNSVSMTSLAKVHANNSTAGYIELFGLINPASGANTVAVTVTASADITAGSVSFTGVDQTTAAGAPATTFGTGFPTSGSVNVTGTTAGNMVVDALGHGSPTSASGQTLRWSGETSTSHGAGCAAQSTADAGGTVNMSYTFGADFFGLIAVEVLAVAAVPDPLRVPVQVICVP